MNTAWKIVSALAVVIGAIAAGIQIFEYMDTQSERKTSASASVSTEVTTLATSELLEKPTSAPANPPVEAADPNPMLSLPFSDNFDSGLNSEWRLVSGSPLIDGGRLTAVEEVKIAIGNNELESYTLAFDVEGVYTDSCSFGYSNYVRLLVTPTLEFRFSRNDYNGHGEWSSLENGDWQDFGRFDGADCGQFRLVVNNGNYKLFINEVNYSDLTLGSDGGSQLVLTINDGVLIDNLTIAP